MRRLLLLLLLLLLPLALAGCSPSREAAVDTTPPGMTMTSLNDHWHVLEGEVGGRPRKFLLYIRRHPGDGSQTTAIVELRD